jgi:hypothetical protein
MKVRTGSVGIGAVAALLAAAALVSHSSSAETSVSQAEAILSAAINAQQSEVVPPPGLEGKAVSPATKARMRGRGVDLLGKNFTGHALNQQEQLLDDGLAKMTELDFVVFDAGVSRYELTSSSRPDADTITLEAKATTWSRVGQVQSDKAVVSTPQNDILVSATLIRGPGGWRVSEFDWTFAPGSEP